VVHVHAAHADVPERFAAGPDDVRDEAGDEKGHQEGGHHPGGQAAAVVHQQLDLDRGHVTSAVRLCDPRQPKLAGPARVREALDRP
jgi:hypothetical protein